MKFTKLFILTLVSLGLTSLSTKVIASETPYVIELAPVAQINYQPFAGLPANERFSIGLKISDSAFSDLQDASEQNNGRRLRVRIRPTDNGDFFVANGAKNLPIEISNLGNSGGFGRNNKNVYQDFRIGDKLRDQNFDFNISIPASIYADPGTFQLPITVELVDRNTNKVIGEADFEVQALVGVSLQSNIAGSSVNQNKNSRFAMVNFGELRSGDSQQVSLQVRGNTSADITLTSEHKGRLQHVDDKQLYIDYSVDADGMASSLETPLNLNRPVEKTLRGSAYPVTIIIGDLRGSFAGEYRDVITVEIRPKL